MMATSYRLPPSASSLSESMRDIGYSLATALADIVDNSIAACATQIDIISDLSMDSPTLLVSDNGEGMDKVELLAAMKHGAANPKNQRSETDLGRFGLGLKTASFSQCRQLTVVSSKQSETVGAEWDLDLVSDEDDWILSVLDKQDIQNLPYIDQLASTGTLVIWRKLDRLFEDQEGNKRDEVVNEKLDLLEKHLGLVFHRFLSGDVKQYKKITIRINGHPVTAFDPFCKSNKATQVLPKEVVSVDGKDVLIQPYILPHHSKLSSKDYEFYKTRSNFISNQGAYVYRNGRLMAWADWFRLVPKGEATKLARVQIDFPNSLDERWTIDIKKSRARPPQDVRDRLRQVIEKIVSTSTRVHRKRGQKLFQEISSPVWERYADNGNIRFALSQTHPFLLGLKDSMSDKQYRSLLGYLDIVSASIPIEMIYSDYSSAPRDFQPVPLDSAATFQSLEQLREVLFGQRAVDVEKFREVIISSRIFDTNMSIVENYIQEVVNESGQE